MQNVCHHTQGGVVEENNKILIKDIDNQYLTYKRTN